MGVMKKIRDFIVSSDEDFDEEDVQIITKNDDRDDRTMPVYQDQGTKKGNGNKVVNIHTTAQLQVILVKPERFDDASSIADHLNEKRTVVLNLESTNKDISRRLVDFLSGVAYANGGQIKRVANSTFLITPYNVDIMGDLIDELESNGVFF